MIISFSASVTGILSKKFAWKINDLSAENLLDPVLNYTEYKNFKRDKPVHMTVLVSIHDWFSKYY